MSDMTTDGPKGVEGPKSTGGDAPRSAPRAEVKDAMARVTPGEVAAERQKVSGDPSSFERTPGESKPGERAAVTRVADTPGGGVPRDVPMNREQLLRNFDPVEGGRHLQSHAGRNRDFAEFRDLRTQTDRQAASQRVVEDILRNPRTAERANGPRFGNGSDFYSPDGRAVRFDGNGRFVGFLDTGTGGGAPRPGGAPVEPAPGSQGPRPGGTPVEPVPGNPGTARAADPAVRPGPEPARPPAAEPAPGNSALGRLGRLGGRLLGPLGIYLMFRDFQQQMEQAGRPPEA